MRLILQGLLPVSLMASARKEVTRAVLPADGFRTLPSNFQPTYGGDVTSSLQPVLPLLCECGHVLQEKEVPAHTSGIHHHHHRPSPELGVLGVVAVVFFGAVGHIVTNGAELVVGILADPRIHGRKDPHEHR